jgi:hypothetical protein
VKLTTFAIRESSMISALVLGCALLGCSKDKAPSTPTTSTTVTPPSTVATTQAIVEDPAATAAEMYDQQGHNYVAPKVLAYGRKLHLVIYPACRGGEGPGESCDIAALDHVGKGADLDAKISWVTVAGRTQDREPAIAALEKLFVESDAVRLSKQAWRGEPFEVANFGTIAWDEKRKTIVATREAATTKVRIEWGDQGGPVALYTSPSAPVAVALLRVNPTSGGREGYVVSVQYAVVPRP